MCLVFVLMGSSRAKLGLKDRQQSQRNSTENLMQSEYRYYQFYLYDEPDKWGNFYISVYSKPSQQEGLARGPLGIVSVILLLQNFNLRNCLGLATARSRK